MKLCEFETKYGTDLSPWAHRFAEQMQDHLGEVVRVEIHSIEPWPTERPEGWGVGCWVRGPSIYTEEGEVVGILIEDDDFISRVIIPNKGYDTVISSRRITAYGPRAEVSG